MDITNMMMTMKSCTKHLKTHFCLVSIIVAKIGGGLFSKWIGDIQCRAMRRNFISSHFSSMQFTVKISCCGGGGERGIRYDQKIKIVKKVDKVDQNITEEIRSKIQFISIVMIFL